MASARTAYTRACENMKIALQKDDQHHAKDAMLLINPPGHANRGTCCSPLAVRDQLVTATLYAALAQRGLSAKLVE